jgi:predicted nucleic acid-binding protein
MTTNTVLADSSYIYALYAKSDKFHQAAQTFSEVFSGEMLVPDVALVEVVYLVSRGGGMPQVARFYDVFRTSGMTLQPITMPDIERIREITATYADARFDFVDTCLMALAERLDIARICTFDRRDFPIFRPRHVDFLELLP